MRGKTNTSAPSSQNAGCPFAIRDCPGRTLIPGEPCSAVSVGRASRNALPALTGLIGFSLRQNQQTGLQQLLRQPVEGLGKFVGDGSHRHPHYRRRFGLRVLLENDAAEQQPVQ